MAFSEVGSGSQRVASGSNNNVDSATLAYPGNVTAGSLLISAGAVWHTSTAPTSIPFTDTLGTSYTTILGAVISGFTWRTCIAWGIAPSSGACTVTCNPNTASNSFSWSMDEFSGQNASPVDVDGGDSTGNMSSGVSGTATDSITTVTNDDLIIGVMSHDTGDRTLTAGTDATLIGANSSNSNNQTHAAIFRIVTTAGAYSMNVNFAAGLGSATPGWSLQTYAFKPSGGGGGGGRILSESGILTSGILTGGALIGGSGKTLFFPSLAKRWRRRRLALA